MIDESHRFVSLRVPSGAKDELFDSAADPEEIQDVLTEQEDVGEEMRLLVDDYLASRAAPWGAPAPEIEIDEMQLNQLRALGYKID